MRRNFIPHFVSAFMQGGKTLEGGVIPVVIHFSLYVTR